MKKHKHLSIYSALLITAIILFGFYNHSNRQKSIGPSAPGFAVVELFTSEGCSSCPAADELAGIITSEDNRNIFILSYHVDYWNRLGWKDVFSSSLYSDRQKQYADIFQLKSIYTPQMIVNGKTEFVGSDEKKLRQVIQQELKNSPSVTIDLRAGSTDNKTVSISCSSNIANKSILNITLVQNHAETAVKKGENAGKMLKHFNIVRDLKKLIFDPMIEAKTTLSIPEGFTSKDFKVIAYMQNIADLKVTAAAEQDIQ